MNTKVKINKVAFFVALLYFAHTSDAYASEIINPPIPPKRPPIFKASPEYIQQLRERLEDSKTSEPVDPLKEIYGTEPPVPEESYQDDDLALSLSEPTRDEILEAIDSKEKIVKTKIAKTVKTRTPKDKPNLDIEPAAGEEKLTLDNSRAEPKQSSKLITFYMQPNQTKLDENITAFLQNKALKLMREDTDLHIEIASFSSRIEGEPHSDARISLARALEVRTFLMKNNIDPARLKLKTSNDYDKNSDDDRIDLIFVKPL